MKKIQTIQKIPTEGRYKGGFLRGSGAILTEIK